MIGNSEICGGGATREIDFTRGTCRHSVKLGCDFSLAGTREVETDAGPEPIGGETSE